MNEYATLKSSPEQDMYISRLVGASVFFHQQWAIVKDGIYQRGFNRSFGCLPEDVAVIIQYDRPIRFTAVAASVIRRHYAGR